MWSSKDIMNIFFYLFCYRYSVEIKICVIEKLFLWNMLSSVETCACDLHLKIIGRVLLHSYLHVTSTLIGKYLKRWEIWWLDNMFLNWLKKPIHPRLGVGHHWDSPSHIMTISFRDFESSVRGMTLWKIVCPTLP